MIKGEKIYLRPILKSDLKHLNKWKNDEEIYRFLGGGFMPVSIDQQEKWLDSMIDLSGNNKRFIICDNQDLSIGMVGLYDINWVHRICEVGIYIGDKTSHGNGFGIEACNLIEGFARDYLNLRKIKLNVVSDNEAAFRMWNTLGYDKVGELVNERFINGEYHNLVIMEKFL
ncbi:GNAT family N-acetyltransferase [Clostridium algidicarnis]|uniref:GNAT family N-acetyltransferase n=1 Tax=Clostridium algidicarnis TaxID=37659 RepID=UPI001C0B2798|nr:GNAT family N-acetyltransferase [Clostridium algidicarnis]MBU3197385.1 GNAT family N-acetyltransferase [Clostridium algidicarnis]